MREVEEEEEEEGKLGCGVGGFFSPTFALTPLFLLLLLLFLLLLLSCLAVVKLTETIWCYFMLAHLLYLDSRQTDRQTRRHTCGSHEAESNFFKQWLLHFTRGETGANEANGNKAADERTLQNVLPPDMSAGPAGRRSFASPS